jgi:hypothetical protein
MRLRLLAIVAATVGGYLAISGLPASATPVGAESPDAVAISIPTESYMQYRGYRRYYAPRRAYFAPRRYYRRAYYRPYRYYRPRYYRPIYGYPAYGYPYYGYRRPGIGVHFGLF